jgi:hypothetical protein
MYVKEFEKSSGVDTSRCGDDLVAFEYASHVAIMIDECFFKCGGGGQSFLHDQREACWKKEHGESEIISAMRYIPRMKVRICLRGALVSRLIDWISMK